MMWFGISGDLLSLITQTVGLLVAFIYGIYGARRGFGVWSLIALGIVTNVIGQLIFAGGGPGAFVGMCGLPILCLISGYAGRAIRPLIVSPANSVVVCECCGATVADEATHCPTCHRLRRCSKCGYNLTGNVSGRCPECGTVIISKGDTNLSE